MKKNPTLTLSVTESCRLDKLLAHEAAHIGVPEAEGLSRAQIQRLIKDGYVAGEAGPVRDTNYTAKAGEVFVLTLPPPVTATPVAEDIPLSVLYEDKDLLVIDKPAGLVVHPGAGNWDHTLVNALLAHCGDSLSGIGGVARPGIVHRLDKETSGLMVVAKNDAAHQALTAQFADRSLSRVYQALVWGVPSPIEGEIEGAIGRHPRSRQKMAVLPRGGKEALTRYKVLEVFGSLAALVECRLATGRTHQIRVHMAHIGHPVMGDPLYGSRRPVAKQEGLVAALQAFGRQALHAGEIKFIHPRAHNPLTYKTSLPKDMAILLDLLRSTKS